MLPDDTMHYISGRVRVRRLYSDLSHASVQVEATCDPWRYSRAETCVGISAGAKEQDALLINGGRCSVVPTIRVEEGSLTLTFGSGTWTLRKGTYTIPDIYLTEGTHLLRYRGTGRATLTWREAML